ATRSSPSYLTRTGGQSGSAISRDRQAGIQYRRIALPIGVPGSTRVISSFSFGGSIGDLLLVALNIWRRVDARIAELPRARQWYCAVRRVWRRSPPTVS